MATQRISLKVGDKFESHYPIRTGPEFEKVAGTVTEIYLAADKVEITGESEQINETVWLIPKIWLISIADAFSKNIHCDRQDS